MYEADDFYEILLIFHMVFIHAIKWFRVHIGNVWLYEKKSLSPETILHKFLKFDVQEWS